MLEKPHIPDETVVACLQADYGLRIAQPTFLPLGCDLASAVYRAVADDGAPYFCKLRRGNFDETSVALPRFLSEQGIAQIIPPIATGTGQLWTTLGEFTLMLYPFVEGKSGYDVELSERQWSEFGAAIKRLHTTPVPPVLAHAIQRERFDGAWRERYRAIIARLDSETFDDPIAADLAAFLRARRDMLLDLVARAERLARVMAGRHTEFVLCHSDIHPGNLFIETTGALYIVDWDYPSFGPKERDLLFIGGGQGFVNITAQEEEARFYAGYGEPNIDTIAMAYCRYERCVTSIVVECERVFSPAVGAENRAMSFQIVQWDCMPDSTIERAFASDQTRGVM
jgi:spectinomycin phosphotransferase